MQSAHALSAVGALAASARPSIAVAWRYNGGRRDLRLDLLRGFAAFAMIVDHVGGERSWLYPLTGGNRFFVSAAEAFVLISGIVLGIVYRGFVEKQGVAAALMKALHRAWMLYAATVLLSLSFAAMSYALGLPWAPEIASSGAAWRFALDVATLHQTVYLVDVLLMYTLLLLIAAPVVLLLSQGRTAIVLGASWLLWVAWQFAPQSASMTWDIRGNDVFNLSAWQVIFVTGAVAGWHRSAIETWVARQPRGTLHASLVAAVAIVAALYVALVGRLEALEANPLLSTLAFDKPDLVVGRLAVLTVLSVVAFLGVTMLWAPINRVTGWLLLPLGQHALTAYALHIFVAGLAAALLAQLPSQLAEQASTATALQLAAVAVVWLAVRNETALRDVAYRLVPAALVRTLTSAGSVQVASDEHASEAHHA